MYGCKMPEDQNKKACYKIQVTEVCSLLLIISPNMIASLIAEMRRFDTREILVPAEKILPPGYAEYLKRVLIANEYSGNVYDMAAEQFRRMEVEQSPCFDSVNVTRKKKTRFDLEAGEIFYMLVRNAKSRFRYVFPDEEGKEISVPLEHL